MHTRGGTMEGEPRPRQELELLIAMLDIRWLESALSSDVWGQPRQNGTSTAHAKTMRPGPALIATRRRESQVLLPFLMKRPRSAERKCTQYAFDRRTRPYKGCLRRLVKAAWSWR